MNAPQLLAGWPEILAAGSREVGGKAWTLARLATLDFPVPAGIVIPVAVFRALRSASEAARAELRAALAASLAAHGWLERPLAVRSSAPEEDSAQASFAGVHCSRLNVVGADAILAAVLDVWASVSAPAAQAYRTRLGLAASGEMAVLIMPLLATNASGIAFTCDPRDGRDDRLVIHANWGLGETLVGGHSEGDEIVLGEDLAEDSLKLLEYRVGSKAESGWPAPGGGTRTTANAAARAAAPCLNATQALALAELLRIAARALDFAHPNYDAEWVWDGTRFWIVQMRPVTAQAPCTYSGLRTQPTIWSRGNTCEVVPDALSPIDWSASRRLVNALLEAGLRLAGFPCHPGAQRGGLFHGRLYLNLSLIQWEIYHGFGVEPERMNRLVGGHQPEIRVPRLGLGAQLRRAAGMLRYILRAEGERRRGEAQVEAIHRQCAIWRRSPLPDTPAALAAHLRAVRRHTGGMHGVFLLQGSGGGSLSLLTEILERRFPGEGHALTSALLAGGEPSVTARQSYELIAIARTALADPLTRAWLTEARRGDGVSLQEWEALPADNAFRLAFSDFLERYGHRGIYETYLRTPRWRERPEALLASLEDLAGTDLEALAARQHAAVTAAKNRLRALPWVLRQWCLRLAAQATRETNGREAARSALTAYIEINRRTLLHLGRQWQEHGWLTQPEHVFDLLEEEILAVLDGRRPGSALAALVAARQSQQAEWAATPPPDYFLVGSEAASPPPAAMPRAASGATRHGTPVGSGRARGRACRLDRPDQGERLARGDVLVVATTDPAWTPLFLKAGALVMETGGFMSHGAIVAREFGIPAVVNLPGILDEIADGDELEVDGWQGRVTRLGAHT